MDTRTLSLFLSLSESLHFSRTSAEQHLSPSALSRTIKQLEETLGTQLFERDNRSVKLTPEGLLLQAYARETLQNWDTFRRSLNHNSGQLYGEISIYCSVTASYSFLYDILSNFRRQHPRIELKLHTGDPEQGIGRVTSGQEDMAIVARPDKLPSSLTYRRIAVSPLVFISPQEATSTLPNPNPQTPQEWASTPMIVSEEGVGRQRINNWFRQMKVTPKIYAQVAGHEAIVSMVALGFGIGVVPKIVLDNSPLLSRVQTLSPLTTSGDPLAADYDVGLCVLKKRLKSPIIKAFWGE